MKMKMKTGMFIVARKKMRMKTMMIIMMKMRMRMNMLRLDMKMRTKIITRDVVEDHAGVGDLVETAAGVMEALIHHVADLPPWTQNREEEWPRKVDAIHMIVKGAAIAVEATVEEAIVEEAIVDEATRVARVEIIQVVLVPHAVDLQLWILSKEGK